MLITLVFFGINFFTSYSEESVAVNGFQVHPVEHSSFAMSLDEVVILNDPVGDVADYADFIQPDLILLSTVFEDHLDVVLLGQLVGSSTIIIAPEAVVEELTEDLAAKTVMMGNGDKHSVYGVEIEAMPMYNITESNLGHKNVRGAGNGYVLEKDGFRVYIAGDTEDINEMRTLENIDVAFIPMSSPDTMRVDVAADAVLDFAPEKVYPYHYLGESGTLSDVEEFARIVQVGNPEIKVVQFDWYPKQ